MKNRPIVRLIIKEIQFTGLLIQYLYLKVCYVSLLIRYHLLKIAGAALIEAVKIEYCIKTLSNGDRIIFAATIAVSIYAVALVMLIRM